MVSHRGKKKSGEMVSEDRGIFLANGLFMGLIGLMGLMALFPPPRFAAAK